MFKRINAILLLTPLLTSCAAMAPIVDTKEADKTTICMSFKWSTPDEIRAQCGTDKFGRSNQACLVNGYLYVGPKPAGFYDETGLISIGHEVLHALGGQHK